MDKLVFDHHKLRNIVNSSPYKKGDLAFELGITRETFSRWLNGKVRQVPKQKLFTLMSILNISSYDDIKPNSDKSKAITEVGAGVAIPLIEGNSVFLQCDTNDLLRVCVKAGDWSLLHQTVDPGFKYTSQIHTHFFAASISSLLEMDFAKLHQLKGLLEYNRDFQIMAQTYLGQALISLMNGDLQDANEKFDSCIIQGQKEWLLGLAYFGQAFIHFVCAEREEARYLCETGISIVKTGEDELTKYIHAQLLILSIHMDGYNKDTVLERTSVIKVINKDLLSREIEARVKLLSHYSLFDDQIKDSQLLPLMQIKGDFDKLENIFRIEYQYIYCLALKRAGRASQARTHAKMLKVICEKSPLMEMLSLELYLGIGSSQGPDPNDREYQMTLNQLRRKLKLINTKRSLSI